MAVVKKFLRYSELRDHGIMLRRKQIDRLESLGLFPKRIKLGLRRVGWLAEEIKAHVEAQIEARE